MLNIKVKLLNGKELIYFLSLRELNQLLAELITEEKTITLNGKLERRDNIVSANVFIREDKKSSKLAHEINVMIP